MNEIPIVRGLYLCEKVIVEEETRFVTLVNCFSRKKARQFPSEPMDFVLYAVLLNGRGRVRLEVVIEDAATMEEIDRHAVAFELSDPLGGLRFNKRYKGLSFPAPGDYEFQLVADGEVIASAMLRLQEELS